MNVKWGRVFFFFFMIHHFLCFSKEPIGEDFLVSALLEDSPVISGNKLKVQESLLMVRKVDDLFQWKSNTVVSTLRSNEIGLSNFEPVTRFRNLLETAVSKKTTFGMDIDMGVSTGQYTNNFIENSTRVGLRGGLSVDLYRDIFGRESRRTYRRVELEREKQGIEYEIGRQKIINDTRKLYWALVFNNESFNILKGLLQQSQRQLNDAHRRREGRIADNSEVSRYESLVSTRRIHIYQLQYKKEELVRTIRELIPSLRDKEIQLGRYDIEQSTRDFNHCTRQIKSFPQTPLANTHYDELVSLVNQSHRNNRQTHESYDDVDIKLIGEIQHFGKDFDYNDSFRGFKKSPHTSYALGLSLSIPLGRGKKKTVEILKKVEDEKKLAQTNEILSKIESLHTQMLVNIGLLEEIMEKQRNNSIHSGRILQESQRKYNQARISARDLIFDQDMVLQNHLDRFETKLTAINMMLDYLSTFTDTTCAFNKRFD